MDIVETPDFLRKIDAKYSHEVSPFLSAIQFRKIQSNIEINEEKMRLAWDNWIKDRCKIIESGVKSSV